MAYVALSDMEIADLYMTFSGGTKTLVRVKKGQAIPVDLLDEKDVKKSLQFGALGRLIDAGWVKEVKDDEVAQLTEAVSSLPSSPAEREAAKSTEQIKAEKAKYAFVETMSTEELHEVRQAKGMTENMDLTGEAGRSVGVDSIHFDKAIVSDKSGGLSVVEPEKRKDFGSEPQDAVVNEKTGQVVKVGATIQNYETKADLGKIGDYESFDGLNHFDKLLWIRSTSNSSVLTEIEQKASAKQLKNEARKRLGQIA